MYKYLRSGLDDEFGILDLQEKILEVMVYIDRFCQEHSIDYCLMAGSALGACRHQGFIPWDDDMDIYMSESDYCKFRTMFELYGDKKKFYLQEWGKYCHDEQCLISMAKLRMNGTKINEKTYDGWNIHQGIFVDIFVVHNCADNLLQQKIQYIWSEALVLKGLQIRGYQAKNFKDRILLNLIKLFPTKLIKRIGLSFVYKYQNDKTAYLHGFIDTRGFSRAVFKRNIIFPTKYVKFENVQLKVPNNLEEYLKIQFGANFMEPPPKSQIKLNKHTSGWEYYSCNNNESYSDEYKLI